MAQRLKRVLIADPSEALKAFRKEQNMPSCKQYFIATMALAGFIQSALAATSVQATETRQATGPRIDLFGEAFTQTRLLNQNQRRLIFYRPVDVAGQEKGVISILVNEQYHAALPHGSFTKLCADQESYTMAAAKRQVGMPAQNWTSSVVGLRAHVLPNQTRYFRTTGTRTGSQQLMEVDPALALEELKGTREAIHTQSRVTAAQSCEEGGLLTQAVEVSPIPDVASKAVVQVMDPVKQPNTVNRFNFAADTLFAFGKATRESMPVQGLRALDELTHKLRQEYKSITEVRVIGHADPIGNELSNMRLSQQRADEVKNYLRSIGLTNVPIHSEGRGAKEMVALHCPTIATPVAIQCHQPNRRVVIEVTGEQELKQGKD